ELIRRMQTTGSDEAGRDLYNLCRNPLLTVIYSALPEELRTLREPKEFLQDTWIALRCAHIPEDVLADPKALGKYVKNTARNGVLDFVRDRYGCRRRNSCRQVPL